MLFPLIAANSNHKFYVSTTNIEFVPKSESVQIISKIFIDDIEKALRKRSGKEVSLATKKETEADRELLKNYIMQKFSISINGEDSKYQYLGIDYETDIVKCYLEITGVSEFKTIEVDNKILFDMFDEQKNIIHVKTPESRKSMVLNIDNPKGLLNF